MIIATGLTEGCGATMLALALLGEETVPRALPLLTCVLAVITAGLWMTYIGRARINRIPLRSREILLSVNEIVVMWWAVGAVVLLACLVAAPLIGYAAFSSALLIGAGALWKFTVIVRASHQQGFVLPAAVGRGSGSFAAPARLDGHKRAA